MRPLSVVSDLKEVIEQACEEAMDCGLEQDQVAAIIREVVNDFMRLSVLK